MNGCSTCGASPFVAKNTPLGFNHKANHTSSGSTLGETSHGYRHVAAGRCRILRNILARFGGCGAAVLAAGFPNLGIAFAGVAFAFGLTVLTMAYAVGHISGGHFNPAVSIGLWSAGRFATRDLIPYIAAQVVAAVVAAAALWLIASSQPGWVPGGFAANGYGDLSPGKYGLGGCFLTEVLMTFFFLFIIIGTTSRGAASGFAGIPIGLGLTLIHLVSIPVTNTSVNPARSTGPALFAGGAHLEQLWLFWVAPIIGAVIAGLLARWMYEREAIIGTVVVGETRVSAD